MARYSNKYNRFEEEDDYDSERSYADELRQRRREKRMKNALRSKRMDEFYDSDDEY
jgi:hypothetical protein